MSTRVSAPKASKINRSTPEGGALTPFERMYRQHFGDRVGAFRRENTGLARAAHALPPKARRAVDVVMIGDSITDDSSPDLGFRIARFVPEAKDRLILNRGIGGDRLHTLNGFGLPGRLGSLVPNVGKDPRHLTLLIGINDLLQGHSPGETLALYEELVTTLQLRFPGSTLHLFTLMHTSGSHASLNGAIDSFNAGLRALGLRLGVEVRESLTQASAAWPQEYPDGLHPQTVGHVYERYAAEVMRIFDAGVKASAAA